MADARLESFRRALLGRGFFAHVAPLRSRPGVASVIWESLVSMPLCSREHFADNRSAHSFFIYIYIDIYKHEAIRIPKSENNIGLCRVGSKYAIFLGRLWRPKKMAYLEPLLGECAAHHRV